MFCGPFLGGGFYDQRNVTFVLLWSENRAHIIFTYKIYECKWGLMNLKKKIRLDLLCEKLGLWVKHNLHLCILWSLISTFVFIILYIQTHIQIQILLCTILPRKLVKIWIKFNSQKNTTVFHTRPELCVTDLGLCICQWMDTNPYTQKSFFAKLYYWEGWKKIHMRIHHFNCSSYSHSARTDIWPSTVQCKQELVMYLKCEFEHRLCDFSFTFINLIKHMHYFCFYTLHIDKFLSVFTFSFSNWCFDLCYATKEPQPTLLPVDSRPHRIVWCHCPLSTAIQTIFPSATESLLLVILHFVKAVVFVGYIFLNCWPYDVNIFCCKNISVQLFLRQNHFSSQPG